MVLTQLRARQGTRWRQRVSIPLWFSRNSRCNRKLRGSKRVSIPLWFSRNGVTVIGCIFRMGFHTTMVLTQPRPAPAVVTRLSSFHTTMVLTQRSLSDSFKERQPVSIPLWFSRNRCAFAGPQKKVCVSIPLWFSRNGGDFRVSGFFVSVSIPLWFSRNRTKVAQEIVKNMFPYHYGSHATCLGL